MATAKLSSFVNPSTKPTTSKSKEDTMAASTAPAPKYAVITLSGESKKGEAWGSHWLITAKPLTDTEAAAMLKVFDVAVAGKPRHSFERKFFRGMTAVLTKAGMPGGAMYWLAGEEQCGLDQVKTMAESVLGSTKATKPAKQEARHAPEQPKAASKAAKGKNTQRKAAEARQAKRSAAYTVVLG